MKQQHEVKLQQMANGNILAMRGRDVFTFASDPMGFIAYPITKAGQEKRFCNSTNKARLIEWAQGIFDCKAFGWRDAG